MFLGINLSHASSACLVNNEGTLIAAIEEERLSRTKNHYGIPSYALSYLIDNIQEDLKIEKVIHGSFSILDDNSFFRIIANTGENPSNPAGSWKPPHPGWIRPVGENHRIIENLINDQIASCGLDRPKHIWMPHHDAHLATALASSRRAGKSKTLLISLDGEGDGESGSVAISTDQNQLLKLSNNSHLDSLGYLYQSVTEKYNFKGNQHEGKITGLAAFGKNSQAVEILSNYINIADGKVSLRYTKNKNHSRFVRALRSIGLKGKYALSINEIVDLASSATIQYEDLAYAIQTVLENSVLEIVNFWLKTTESKSLAVAGGVFANVKLNQKISDLTELNFFDVFPNMGDGGLSAGGVWAYLAKNNRFLTNEPYSDMFLAPDNDRIENYKGIGEISIEEFSRRDLSIKAAELIVSGNLVGLHYGKMEFGPRALGHRTLLIDPRRKELLMYANQRLKRTEFMLFAPVVHRKNFMRFFHAPPEVRPGFEFMTVTCKVRNEMQHRIPAVTHVDGTARPQIIEDDADDLYSDILIQFEKITGVGVLVNTSLNVHESPINFQLQDSIQGLIDGAFDYIVTSNHLISRRSLS